MKWNKLHMRIEKGSSKSLCGYRYIGGPTSLGMSTGIPEHVTCKTCKKIMEKAQTSGSEFYTRTLTPMPLAC